MRFEGCYVIVIPVTSALVFVPTRPHFSDGGRPHPRSGTSATPPPRQPPPRHRHLLRRRSRHPLARFELTKAGQIDGTTSHALERVIGILAADAGLRVLQRSDLPGATAAT